MEIFVFEDEDIISSGDIKVIPKGNFIEVDLAKQSFDNIIAIIRNSKKKYVLVSCSNDIYNTELKMHKLILWALKKNLILQIKDVPLCYLQDFPWLSYDLKLKFLNEEGLVKGFVEKNKSVACEKCALKQFCPGVESRFKNQVFAVFKSKDEVLLKAKRGFGIKEKVAVLGKFKDYQDFSSILNAITKGLDEFGGVEKLIPKGAKVLIKPNLAELLPPEKAATTHPTIIQAVVRMVKEVTDKIYISDLAAGTNYQNFEKLITITGIKDVAVAENVKVVDMSKDGFVVKKIKNYFWLEKTDYLSFLDDVEVIINVPKMKTHGLTFFTCCVKSCLGLIHPEERKYIHSKEDRFDFAKGVVDVYSRIKDKIVLHVVDGVMAMEGDEGPSYGDPVNTGLIVIGQDGVAVDAVISKVMGYVPEHLPTLKYAAQKYLGEAFLENTQIVGDFKDANEITHKGFKKHSLFSYLNRFKNEKDFGRAYIYRVSIDQTKCNLCKTCYNSCPAGSIVFDDSGRLAVAEDKCIHCYTCHEVCPSGAIKLTKAPNF